MRFLVHEYVGRALTVLTMFQSEHVRGKENRILALFRKNCSQLIGVQRFVRTSKPQDNIRS